jgi:NAD(P)-dependent dehydrogenase (short-subunit alcohol dehydrogenase family)
MEQWFEHKVALVTGGGDGIGRATALLFAQRGAKVVVADINQPAGAKTVEQIRASQGEAVLVTGDVADSDAVQSFIREALDRYGRLDCAFNNAGIRHPKDTEWNEAAFRATLEVNLVGVMICLKHEIAAMLRTGGGTVVNTASTHAFAASAVTPLPAYTSSKHAIIGLTKTAALQYARQNVRVNALCPGVTLTGIVQNLIDQHPDARAKLENFAPMGRMATPAEIAEAAVWLCSEKASFITGHALVVDGGFLAQ